MESSRPEKSLFVMLTRLESQLSARLHVPRTIPEI